MKHLTLFLFVAVMLTACTTTKVVTVPEVHTEYVHTRDSIHHVDSVIKEKETTIMQLDSVAMAEYGIRLENAERAWLIKTKELERELQRLSQVKVDTVVKIDSIPYPVDRPVEVEKELSWWQELRLKLGNLMIILIGCAVVYAVIKLYLKFRKPYTI